MEFTRHARNKLRFYGLTTDEIEALIANPHEIATRADGKLAALGTIRQHHYMAVYVVEDGAATVITVWERD